MISEDLTGTVRLVMGLPCSGKTTYIKETSGPRQDLEILNAKTLRNVGRMIRYLKAVFFEQKVAVLEGTFESRKSRRKIIDFILASNVALDCTLISTPLEECLRRNAERPPETRLPPRAIKKMAASMELPDNFEGFRRVKVVQWNGECRGQETLRTS